MQRTEMVALVSGATMGVGAGALGAFLVCTAGRVVARRFMDQFDDHVLDFGEPALPTAWRSAQAGSLNGASEARLARDQLRLISSKR